MSKILLREQAIKLRIEGHTYGQIRRTLGVSKSTLSGWLKNLPLSSEQTILLTKNKSLAKDLAIEKYRITRTNQRLERIKKVLIQQEKALLPLSKRELFFAGLFLYWGEGAKLRGRVSISNTDPKIIKFALFWMTEILNIPSDKILVRLHLYKDMNGEEVISFWSACLNLPKEQFGKPYIKKSNREGLTYKSFGHGTCNLHYGSVALSDMIAMSIKSVSDKYGVKSDLFWYN